MGRVRRLWVAAPLAVIATAVVSLSWAGQSSADDGAHTPPPLDPLPPALQPIIVELGTGTPPRVQAFTSVVQAPTVGAATVFGVDDRIPVADTTQWPWRTVVYLEAYDYFGYYIGSCSGSLVGPNVVLTAAHCVWDDLFDDYAGTIFVAPAMSPLGSPFGYVEATRMLVPSGYTDDYGPEFDFALVALDAVPWGDIGPYMWIAALPDVAFYDPDTYLVSAGFPGDKTPYSMWFTAGFELFVDEELIYTQMDAFPGQSGSSIYLVNPDPALAFVTGVYSTEGYLSNQAVRFNPLHLAAFHQYCEWLYCSLNTIDLTDVPEPTPTPSPSPTSTPTPSPTPSPSPSPTPTLPFKVRIPLVATG